MISGKTLKKITSLLLLFSASTILHGEGKKEARDIAVVKGRFDPIEKVLRAYRISFETISYPELQDPAILKKYRLIFFPCGMEPPLHEHIRLKSQGRSIHSVAIRKEIASISQDKITKNIRSFIDEGGKAYFSGYTVKFLNQAYNDFTFFNDFPYMGMPGRIVARLKGDMAHFSIKNEMALYMTHSGWITLKEVNDAEILASAFFETPRGTRGGPVALYMERGKGEVIYTSYHSTVFSDYRRFNIYRLAGSHLIAALREKIDRWEQEKTASLADSFHRGERVRTYRIPLRIGMNTLYVLAENAPLQVDILDRESRIILSRDMHRRYEEIDIPSPRDTYCIIRLFPDTRERHGLHAVAAARGRRVIPHMTPIMIAAGIITAAGIFLIMALFFDRRRYSPPGFGTG